MSEQVAVAKAIAHVAHRGQVDKAGAPYIQHPATVAALIEAEGAFGENFIAAAWLHDVLEDAKPYMYASDLEGAGVDYEIASAVQDLSRNWQPQQDYYARIARNDLALVVKFADIAHNSSPERLAKLAPEVAARLIAKYRKAVESLMSAAPKWVWDNAFGENHDLFGVMDNLGLNEPDGADSEQWQAAAVPDSAPAADSRNQHDNSL